VTLLQNELILPRDPHLAQRLVVLLEENFEPKPVSEIANLPSDGVSVTAETQEPSAADPTLTSSETSSEPDLDPAAPSSISEASESTPEAGSSSPQQTESEAS